MSFIIDPNLTTEEFESISDRVGVIIVCESNIDQAIAGEKNKQRNSTFEI